VVLHQKESKRRHHMRKRIRSGRREYSSTARKSRRK